MKRMPKTLKGFVGRYGEKRLLEMLNAGFNMPPKLEEPGLLKAETIKQFRMIVRNYSKGIGAPIESCVDLILPSFLKVLEKEMRESLKEI